MNLDINELTMITYGLSEYNCCLKLEVWNLDAANNISAMNKMFIMFSG